MAIKVRSSDILGKFRGSCLDEEEIRGKKEKRTRRKENTAVTNLMKFFIGWATGAFFWLWREPRIETEIFFLARLAQLLCVRA